jgi:L-rhamnono-1,4-lactonase
MASSAPEIVDSHMHLFPADELDSCNWYAPGHPLGAEHSLAQYSAAVSSPHSHSATTTTGRVGSFIFIEADRKHDLTSTPPDYSGPLAELAYLRRLLESSSSSADSDDTTPKCIAVVPWAPLPLGADAMEKYLVEAEKAAGPEVWSRVRGFRYLVQDKPTGTMLGDGFIEGLKFLGKKGFAFDLGVDANRRERSHLTEAVEMVGRAHEGVPEEERVTIIISEFLSVHVFGQVYTIPQHTQSNWGCCLEISNLTLPPTDHLLKPNLAILNPADPAFDAWPTAIYTLSCFPRTYLKLSGGFSEMPESLLSRDQAKDVADGMLMWLGPVLASFGPERIMFGSDWPVCTAAGLEGKKGGNGDVEDNDKKDDKVNGDAWARWKGVVERMVWMGTLDDRGLERVWGGTAREAYGIKE